MLKQEAVVVVADNTGAKKAKYIHTPGQKRRHGGQVGDIVKIHVREAAPDASIKKGAVCDAVVVRTRNAIRRADGSYLRFDENAVVIIDTKNNNPKGTRIFGPVARELRAGFMKIISLAPEVL